MTPGPIDQTYRLCKTRSEMTNITCTPQPDLRQLGELQTLSHAMSLHICPYMHRFCCTKVIWCSCVLKPWHEACKQPLDATSSSCCIPVLYCIDVHCHHPLATPSAPVSSADSSTRDGEVQLRVSAATAYNLCAAVHLKAAELVQT
jgi:hypothetical protein